MTTTFEQQLEQMLPAMRIPPPKATRTHSLAKIALGFLLGVAATYCFMQPHDSTHDSARETPQQESFMVVFDDKNLDQLRRPADLFQNVVRVPVPKVAVPHWEGDQTQWQYGTLRNSLRQM
jgi:hypothetical protein